ncbi:uncharacterized protein LOC110852124 isoform X1 [Folsomia candida]|uniref:uncharacterized protein LOC110852124 isoform X1 n=1 Tax=Folsomia candida TaxID=158441 RepID=UPI000B8F5A83|nr:uncharacterized protein LOC110852124 isoform X1 [Folsomia candida]
MWYWGLSSGEALFLVGTLDTMLAVSSTCETFAIHFHKVGVDKDKFLEFNHHLAAYSSWALLGMEGSKLGWSLLLWIGGLILGKRHVLKVWIYISLVHEVLLQLLVWISEYHHHHSLPDHGGASRTLLLIRITYAALVRLLFRTCLVVSAAFFLRRWGRVSTEEEVDVREVQGSACNPVPSGDVAFQKDEFGSSGGARSLLSALPGPSSSSSFIQLPPILTVPQDFEILPVGSGLPNTLRFYYGDISRLIKLLLTIDFTWGIFRLVEREVSQLVFGAGIMMGTYPLSSVSTPIFTEERIIRIFRLTFDAIFLHNLHHDKPPFEGHLILPKLVEICVSLGILVFIRVVDHAFPLFTIFYVFFVLDLLFRAVTFALCYKAYGDFLCRRHRHAVTAVANRNLKRINSVIARPT